MRSVVDVKDKFNASAIQQMDYNLFLTLHLLSFKSSTKIKELIRLYAGIFSKCSSDFETILSFT
jgi:hypothetical protein